MANTTTPQITEAVKAGDWVLPITVNGATVYALQINKSKEDKANLDNILAEYAKAGVEVFTYKGKNDAPVYLVEASKKLKATRTSASTEKLVTSAMATFGCTEEQARAMVAMAKSL